jgi:hypothetical protein
VDLWTFKGKNSMTPEHEIKDAIRAFLENNGFFVINLATGRLRTADGKRWVSVGKKGAADLIGCLPDGRFIAGEVKAPNGRLSPEQQAFLEKIAGLGGLAIFAKSVEDVADALKRGGYLLELF